MRCSKIFFITLLICMLALQGCTVLAIADTVGSVAVGAAGMAADAAIGTVKITGKAVGAVADAVIPGGDSKK
jgi:hypothetical protein